MFVGVANSVSTKILGVLVWGLGDREFIYFSLFLFMCMYILFFAYSLLFFSFFFPWPRCVCFHAGCAGLLSDGPAEWRLALSHRQRRPNHQTVASPLWGVDAELERKRRAVRTERALWRGPRPGISPYGTGDGVGCGVDGNRVLGPGKRREVGGGRVQPRPRVRRYVTAVVVDLKAL